MNLEKIDFFFDISKHIYIVLETSKKFPRYPENLLAYFGNFQKKSKILICMDISMEISKKKNQTVHIANVQYLV